MSSIFGEKLKLLREQKGLKQKELGDILNYVSNTKSDKVRLERITAYSTLFYALFDLYGKRDLTLVRTELGKPYLLENNERSNINVSISHTNGLVAVALSDEYEIGVDIEREIDADRAERLEKRFFGNINIKEENINEKIFLLNFNGNTVIFENIESNEADTMDFTSKWVYGESLLKCDGCGFLGLDKISEIQENTKTSIRKIKVNKKQFFISTTIKAL